MKDNTPFILVTDEYEQNNQKILSEFPDLKIKFRDELCLTGKRYNYDDLSKVKVAYKDTDFIIEPLIFTTDKTKDVTHSLDYAGVYTIGVAEILFLVILKDTGVIGEILNNLYNSSLNIWEDYSEVIKTLYKISPSYENEYNKQYFEMLQISLAMRTDYTLDGYSIILQLINILLIIWFTDKRKYWQIWFEIMNFCKPFLLSILKEEIIEEHKEIIISEFGISDNKSIEEKIDLLLNFYNSIDYWIKPTDVYFNKFEYTVPTINNTRHITCCRGIAIHLSVKLYLEFLSNFGYMRSNEPPRFNYKDVRYINYLDKIIKNCIGNDIQSKVLKGININKPYLLEGSGYYLYSEKQITNKYNISNCDMPKDLYENFVLFMKANFNKIPNGDYFHTGNHFMQYCSFHSLCGAIGFILYSGKNLFLVDTSKFVRKIESLEQEKAKLKNENDKIKKSIMEIKNTTVHIDEISSLQEEVKKLQQLVESKTNIIENLTIKNKELSNLFTNIFDEDSITDEEIEESQVSQEEMIQTLNSFNFTFIGGRNELLQKLSDLSWTNIVQYGKDDIAKLSGSTSQSDFYVVNTKFISHSLFHKVESVDNISNDVIIYYNGTNVDKLIYTCYEFIQNYFK